MKQDYYRRVVTSCPRYEGSRDRIMTDIDLDLCVLTTNAQGRVFLLAPSIDGKETHWVALNGTGCMTFPSVFKRIDAAG